MRCIQPKASAEFVCHMEDVLAVSHRPYDPRRPVMCMDETTKQLIGEVREPLPPAPGQVERYDSVYVCNGLASLFLAFEPLAGWRGVKITESRARCDWVHFHPRTRRWPVAGPKARPTIAAEANGPPSNRVLLSRWTWPVRAR